MIVLDASVIIARSVRGDTHAEAAFDIMNTDDELTIHPITLAECLVGPMRRGVSGEALTALDRIGVVRTIPPLDEPVDLARIRVRTGLRMPDCCVLVASQQVAGTVATFDKRLADAARELGLAAVGA